MDRAAARLKAMLPPEVLKGEEQSGDGDPADQIAELEKQIVAMQQQGQQAEQLLQVAQAKIAELSSKSKDAEAERTLKWKIELLNAEVQIYKANLDANIKQKQLRAQDLDALINAKGGEDVAEIETDGTEKPEQTETPETEAPETTETPEPEAKAE
jgi:seryl-tRNA synthetase